MKQCVFCGSTQNVLYTDPVQGPVCLTCWMTLGDELEEGEKSQKLQREDEDEGGLSL